MVIHRLLRTPIAQIFLSFPLISASIQHPVSPADRPASIPYSANVRYDHFFHIAEVLTNIGIKFFKVENWITNYLLRAMKSNIASAVGTEKNQCPSPSGSSSLINTFSILPLFPRCINGWMFDEKKIMLSSS